MQLNVRQKEIVIQLTQQHRYTIDSLAELFQVSRRTIYNDIARIKSWAIEERIVFKQDDAVPYFDDSIWSYLNAMEDDVNPFLVPTNQRDRLNLILLDILFPDKTNYVDAILKNRGISRSTFYRDLEYIRAWFAQLDIELDISKDSGIQLIGMESMIRDAMVYYISKIFQQINIFDALLRQDNWNKYLDTVGKQVLDRLSEKNSATMIQNILDKVQTFESVMQYHFLENKKISFIWMFILSAQRYRNGHPVEQSYRIEKSSFEYLVVKEMGLQYDLSEDEVCFLAFHLKLIRKRMAKDYHIDSTLDFRIYKFIEKISLDLGYPFMKDLELMNNIKKHMYAMMERQQMGIVDRNPLKDTIVQKYAELYAITVDVLQKCGLFKKEVSDDEASYVVVYLAAAMEKGKQKRRVYVVCTTGQGSALLLMANLEARIPSVEVLECTNIHKARLLSRSDAELIISTTYFHHSALPVVVVSPLLTNEDIAKVTSILGVESAANTNKAELFEQQDSFFAYMNLFTDCVNCVKQLEVVIHPLATDEFMAVVIHFMMQITQNRHHDSHLVEADLDDGADRIYRCIESLYAQYDCQVSMYDIKSINLYFNNEDESENSERTGL